jgi:undecaprenyl diphosphate synthase
MNIPVPHHLAIVVDGNRRWARARGMEPWMGHRHGAQTVEKFLEWCLELNIKQVSVYALSTENMSRSRRELKELFNLYYEFGKMWESKQSLFDKYEVRVRFIGDLNRLPKKLLNLMEGLMQKTSKYQKKFLNIMINYGGRLELLNVIKKIAAKALKVGRVQITERDVEGNLWVSAPVDLLIRTGGYHRLSNFLLWQAAYAEIYVTNTLWPDFSKKELIKAIKWFNSTKRNFGR